MQPHVTYTEGIPDKDSTQDTFSIRLRSRTNSNTAIQQKHTSVGDQQREHHASQCGNVGLSAAWNSFISNDHQLVFVEFGIVLKTFLFVSHLSRVSMIVWRPAKRRKKNPEYITWIFYNKLCLYRIFIGSRSGKEIINTLRLVVDGCYSTAFDEWDCSNAVQPWLRATVLAFERAIARTKESGSESER